MGGRKTAGRAFRPTGTAIEEVVYAGRPAEAGADERLMQRSLMRAGEVAADVGTLADARERLRAAMITLPWDGLKLSRGEPAIPTRIVDPG